VHAAIRENSRLTVREVSEEVGISKSSCHTILTEKLEFYCVAAKFLVKHETTIVVPQPPYSPDLAPADFFLFPRLKSTLKGR
jgi:hypothetical protein